MRSDWADSARASGPILPAWLATTSRATWSCRSAALRARCTCSRGMTRGVIGSVIRSRTFALAPSSASFASRSRLKVAIESGLTPASGRRPARARQQLGGRIGDGARLGRREAQLHDPRVARPHLDCGARHRVVIGPVQSEASPRWVRTATSASLNPFVESGPSSASAKLSSSGGDMDPLVDDDQARSRPLRPNRRRGPRVQAMHVGP